MIARTFCKYHGEGRFNVAEGAIIPACCQYAIVRREDDKMGKELEFKHVYICLQVLMQKGACDEGVLWYSKKYIKDGNITPTLENLYKEVPKQEWQNWLLEKFSEHIKVKEKKYCCNEFEYNLKNNWYIFMDGRYRVTCKCPNHNEGGIFPLIYCPDCGKKLEV